MSERAPSEAVRRLAWERSGSVRTLAAAPTIILEAARERRALALWSIRRALGRLELVLTPLALRRLVAGLHIHRVVSARRLLVAEDQPEVMARALGHLERHTSVRIAAIVVRADDRQPRIRDEGESMTGTEVDGGRD